MNKEQVIKEIKELESSRYDRNIAQENKEDKVALISLYKQLGTPLSMEDKNEVIKSRTITMVDSAGVNALEDLHPHFEDEKVS